MHYISSPLLFTAICSSRISYINMDMSKLIFACSLLIAFGLIGSHAAVLPQVYWNIVLPNTPMPNAIRELLYSEYTEKEKGGDSKPVTEPTISIYNQAATEDQLRNNPNAALLSLEKDIYPDAKLSLHFTRNTAGHVGLTKPAETVTEPTISIYNRAATEDQLRDNPNFALFSLEKDIYPDAKMNLHFPRTTTTSTSSSPAATFLLPRWEADSISFSSNKLPEILSRFSIPPDSIDAKIMAETLQVCEDTTVEGETRTCATSLESMVDFATANLGTRDVLALSTVVNKEATPKQKYTINSIKRLGGEEESSKVVICHARPYIYAVFYCHATSNTRAYMVSMEGEDGTTKAEAAVVCHADTSKWNPKHIALQVLDVKPGGAPVCHFLQQDHIVWVPKK